MHRLLRVLPLAVLLTAGPLAACGGDDGEDDTPVTSTPATGPGDTATGDTATTPGTMSDNSGPATSGNDSVITGAPDNGTGDDSGAGEDGDDSDISDSQPVVATTGGTEG